MTTEEARGQRRDRWARIGVQAWAIIGVLILVALTVEAIIYMWDALWPFVVALIVVVALNYPVSWLANRGWSRVQATAVCYAAFVVVAVLASLFLFPPLYARLEELVRNLPRYSATALQFLQGTLSRSRGPGVPSWVPEVIDSVEANVAKLSKEVSGEMARTAADAVAKALDLLVKLLLGLLVSFYVLIDLPKLRAEMMRLAAVRHRDELAVVFDRVSVTLGGWLRGTVFDSVIIGALYVVAFVALEVPYGFIIGLIGGIFNFVPWVGPGLTLLLAVFAGLFVSPSTALWAAIAVIVIRQVDDFLVAPRVMSDSVDLHPVLVVFSLLAGATLFGFVGLLLAIPLAAIAKSLFVYFYEKGTQRQLAAEDGVIFKLPEEEPAESSGSRHRRASDSAPDEETEQK